MTHEIVLKAVGEGWFNLPGNHPHCTYLRQHKLVKAYRHYGIDRWSMILTPAAQAMRKAFLQRT